MHLVAIELLLNKKLAISDCFVQFLSEHHERSLELMAEVAKLEKGPSVMAPMIRGTVNGLSQSCIVSVNL